MLHEHLTNAPQISHGTSCMLDAFYGFKIPLAKAIPGMNMNMRRMIVLV